jgi:hypothetical protein
MQILVILIMAALWVITFWIGSVALEATGMQRTKARFQVLSAITGTGFTTSEAEAIVNHPTRRRIVTWLIFIGNTGAIAFIIGLILFVRAGIRTPSVSQIVIIVAAVLIPIFFIKLGIVDKITGGIIGLMHRRRPDSYILAEEVLHQAGQYGVARLAVSKKEAADFTIRDTGYLERGITILAIERGDKTLSLPKAEERLMAGDYLLCYGKVSEMLKTTG